MRFAYADPPYPGMANRYPEKTEVDHAEMVTFLMSNFPDGWAFSTSSVALHDLVPVIPRDARVASWVKPWASYKPGVSVAYTWEPVIFSGGRKRPRGTMARDSLVAMPVQREPFFGSKPERFGWWIFELWNALPGDDFVDLFPGSGAMGRAWESFHRLLKLPFGNGPPPAPGGGGCW